jgi:hypothetical protein
MFFFGKSAVCFIADAPTIDNEDLAVLTEFFNLLEVGGFPPHIWELKIGAPIILLRNICPKIFPHVIEALVATCSHIGNVTYIPKIKLLSCNEPTTLPLSFLKAQFYVRLAFVMTIKKTQGQTMDHVGLYLPKHVLSHGQFYVALS